MVRPCSMRARNECWSEELKGRDHLEGLGIDGKMILKCVLKELGGICGLNAIRLG
jgi:hypothetical protein